MRETDKFLPNERDEWHWSLSRTEDDVNDIVAMAKDFYEDEVNTVFKTNPAIMRRNVDVATTDQKYAQNRQLLNICRHKTTGKLLAYTWLKRGHYTVYAPEEMADAMFLHIDLNLSDRQRITIAAQGIQQWILWCKLHGVPVIISSSVRAEQETFLKLHEKFGFIRNGSVCYMAVKDYFQ